MASLLGNIRVSYRLANAVICAPCYSLTSKELQRHAACTAAFTTFRYVRLIVGG